MLVNHGHFTNKKFYALDWFSPTHLTSHTRTHLSCNKTSNVFSSRPSLTFTSLPPTSKKKKSCRKRRPSCEAEWGRNLWSLQNTSCWRGTTFFPEKLRGWSEKEGHVRKAVNYLKEETIWVVCGGGEWHKLAAMNAVAENQSRLRVFFLRAHVVNGSPAF